MKILVISDLYPPYYIGGYEINCKDVVDALIGRGHQVNVLTSSWGISRSLIQENIYRLLAIDPTYLENKLQGKSWLIAFLLKRYFQIRRRIIISRNYQITQKVASQLQPDIIYLWGLDAVTIGPALSIQDLNLPMVFRVEDYSLANIKKLSSEKVNLVKSLYRSLILGTRDVERLRTNHLLVISQAVKNQYIADGFSEFSMTILPSGLPHHILHDPVGRVDKLFSGPDHKIHLVFVGRIEIEKGPDLAIQAIARLKKELAVPVAVHLDIVGSGNLEYLAYLKQLVICIGVDEQVSFLGKCAHDEIIKRLQSYDAFLFTSRWEEPFGRVVIEAMAQGLPVIATQSGGVPEIISDGEDGLLIPIDDVDALAQAVARLIQTPDLVEHLSKNAFATICSRFTIEQVTNFLEEYLFDIVAHH